MNAGPDHSLEQTITSEHRGVRVWSIQASSMQELIDQLAVVLGEHMADGDELHVAYNGMQNGAEPRQRHHLLRQPEQWTELQFEYSALIVLRARGGRGIVDSRADGRPEID